MASPAPEPLFFKEIQRLFLSAVERGDEDAIRRWRRADGRVVIEPDRRTGFLPLIAAVYSDRLTEEKRIRVLKILVHEFSSSILDPPCSRYSNSLLHWLVLHDRALSLEWALSLSFIDAAFIDALNADGHSALHLAVNSGRSAISAVLLRSGASPDVAGAGGNTPLHIAVRRLDVASARLLLQSGADVDSRNDAKETPTMALFVEHHSTGFRVSSRVSRCPESRETLIATILETLIVNGCDVKAQIPFVDRELNVISTTTARGLAFSAGYHAAAERLLQQERTLERFHWLLRPAAVDPCRPLVSLLCPSLDAAESFFVGVGAEDRRSPSRLGFADRDRESRMGVTRVMALGDDEFVFDVLPLDSDSLPHLARVLAAPLPPLVVYLAQSSEEADDVLASISLRLTQIAEAASFRKPLPLLRTSALICMIDAGLPIVRTDGGDVLVEFFVPPEVLLFNVIEKAKTLFGSRADVELWQDFSEGAESDDLFILSASRESVWRNLRTKLRLYRRSTILSLPPVDNLAAELLRDTESMNLPPRYDSFEDAVYFLRLEMHPLVTSRMAMECLKTLEIRGEALFVERAPGSDVYNTNASISASIVVSPFSGLNWDRMRLSSSCAGGDRAFDLASLISSGVATSPVLRRLLADALDFDEFGVELRPSLEDLEWNCEGVAEEDSDAASTPLLFEYFLLKGGSGRRESINPLALPLIALALKSRSSGSGKVVTKIGGRAAWTQDAASLSEACFYLKEDFSSLFVVTRSLKASPSPSMLEYVKFKTDVAERIERCLGALHEALEVVKRSPSNELLSKNSFRIRDLDQDHLG